jgi:GH15 family glucan-1,4-alpha-glucosidase
VPSHLVIGNGKLLINLDQHSFIRDIYYPYVGEFNHVSGFPCRIGLWINGQFSWMNDSTWDINLSYVQDSLVTEVTAVNKDLGLSLTMFDGVHQRDNIYIKKINVYNHDTAEKSVRLFFSQDLSINETEVGDTAVYYPQNHTVFHYKKNRYFMFNGSSENGGIYQYTTGIKRFQQAQGTWKDAEDGELSGNPIAQGSVDSTLCIQMVLPPSTEKTAYYWMSVGENLEEVKKLNTYVLESSPGKLLERVQVYWQHWANKNARNYADLSLDVIHLFKQSLLIVRTQTDIRGAIIAANDSDILQYNRDHYSYMWPRDGALIAYAMSSAGYMEMIVPFFQFCAKALTPDGYLQHKYNPDGTVGSSWHPYKDGEENRLPIQEDETALVLFALWEYYEKSGNIELVQSLYRNLIRKAARFLSDFIEPELNLPSPSYDLWEERFGIYTFTSSAVYGGLIAAANFSDLFGDQDRSEHYRKIAENIKDSILARLWEDRSQRFARGLYQEDGKWVKDMTMESSVYGIFEFGVLPAHDERVMKTMRSIKQNLSIQTPIGGIARYEHDYYFQRSQDINKVPGNPWFICTLWVAEWEIEAAQTLEDLTTPRKTLEWVNQYAMESGILSEQLDPFDGSPISVAPLTWSHATFVLTAVKYMTKYEELINKK